ncbi:HAD family hydrolase [Umezawaea beigongshangensis]|uniref:HAD family hydrolase n=1 Tax=Umezawaea beigongshangensis TaxID=2780383 RepID=UPI0018F14969|nr:HAD-IIB family hydrolase [Umezawaea beigongshangensis]
MAQPHWRPRLVALDIDGTIARSGENDIAPAVRASINRAVEHGAHVVLSTGRSLIGTTPVADDLALPDSLSLCSNGAVWWDSGTREVVRHTTFDPAPAVEALRALLPGAVFAVEITGVGNAAFGRFPEGELWGVVQQVDLAGLVTRPTARLVARWNDHTPAELGLRVAELELPGTAWSSDHTEPWLTVVPAGVSKGSALEELRVQLGVAAEDTLAVGDGHNDVEMLRWAARGVAMGQAPATVRAAADEVTATVLEDGAAMALDKYFP